jgi:acetyltransferase-like isoleucine patch superfamily enzyme
MLPKMSYPTSLINKSKVEQAIGLYTRFFAIIYTAILRSSFSKFERGSRIVPPFRFSNLKAIQIGKMVIFNSNCWIQTIPLNEKDFQTKLVFKDNAIIGMNATITAANYIEIGEYVLMGRNVFISDHDHEYRDINIPVCLQGVMGNEKVIIGAGSWLGHNSVVLPGATIGKHCIIGANSVVNTFIPDYSIAVGSPARVVKQFSKQTGRWEKVSK